MTLDWQEEQPDVWVAYSDQLRIGHVLRRHDESIYFDATLAVFLKWIAKPSHGEVASFDAGKRAVEKAWALWCQKAGLTRIAS